MLFYEGMDLIIVFTVQCPYMKPEVLIISSVTLSRVTGEFLRAMPLINTHTHTHTHTSGLTLTKL